MDRHAQDWGGEVSILRCHVTVTAWVLAMSTSRIVRTGTQRSKRNEVNLRSVCVTLYRAGGDGSDDDVESRMEPRSSAACLTSVERYCTVVVRSGVV